jgi:hypothetical protein
MGFSLSTWFFRKRVQAEVHLSGRPVQTHRVVNPFHAVSVVADSRACEAARNLQGVRFLSTEAPRLPLQGCSSASCRCRYAHHPDRREGSDRRNRDVWNPLVAMQMNDRRHSRGRRITDQ